MPFCAMPSLFESFFWWNWPQTGYLKSKHWVVDDSGRCGMKWYQHNVKIYPFDFLANFKGRNHGILATTSKLWFSSRPLPLHLCLLLPLSYPLLDDQLPILNFTFDSHRKFLQFLTSRKLIYKLTNVANSFLTVPKCFL